MGKKILVVAATAKEIAPFIDLARAGNFPNVDILISGIGLTACTYHLTRQLTIKKYELVIQPGVAGCFELTVDPGQVVAVKQDAIADQSVIELARLKTLFDLTLVPQDQFPYQKGWLINPNKEILKRSKLKLVKGISVNQISTSKQMIRFYRDVFDPVTESMEGAALHYVCLMENVAFLQIRSISNYVGERNKKKWNMKDSIFNLNNALVGIINNY
ncbi:MAG TPA: futalosine hydrolase [Chitinophagaceae bacterium]|nr:futalosine hydrolase [Chitinophagaceae bacterium]